MQPDMQFVNSDQLLNPNERNGLNDFFNNGPSADTLWGDFWPSLPPQVHGISTIPNQQHVSNPQHSNPHGHEINTISNQQHGSSQQHNIHEQQQSYGQPFMSTPRYSQSQAIPMWNMMPTSHHSEPMAMNGAKQFGQPMAPPPTKEHQESVTENLINGVPMVNTSNGPVHEQIASLLPNYGEPGTLDAQFASQFARVPHEMITGRRLPSTSAVRPRHFTFGSDTAFDPSGYKAADPDTVEKVHERLVEPIVYNITKGGNDLPLPTPRRASEVRRGSSVTLLKADTNNSDTIKGEEPPTDADDNTEDGRSAKRRKSASARGRGGRPRPSPRPSRRRGNGTAGQARSTLTEDQKRENHIKSEQKRRNQIRRAHENLRRIIPGLRTQNTNRAGEVHATTAFLLELLRNNTELKRLLGEEADEEIGQAPTE